MFTQGAKTYTLPKTNMEMENHHVSQEIHLRMAGFSIEVFIPQRAGRAGRRRSIEIVLLYGPSKPGMTLGAAEISWESKGWSLG